MIRYQQVNQNYFEQYDSVDMIVHVKAEYRIRKINRGLGGFLLEEHPVDEYMKDFGKCATDCKNRWKGISNWGFFMAFDDETAVGAATIAARTEEINMLDGRDDLAVLWDIRVSDQYKYQGVGQHLIDMSIDWCREQGFRQLKIECQNNNVPACKFYHKQGAVLSEINEYAYWNEEESRNEVQLIWYLDL